MARLAGVSTATVSYVVNERANERVQAILDEHEPEPLPDSVRQEIAYTLDQR